MVLGTIAYFGTQFGATAGLVSAQVAFGAAIVLLFIWAAVVM
jgi:hypothetical protein